MKDLFVSYEQALELKQLGFDEPCFGFYTNNGEIRRRRYINFDGELSDFQTLKNSRITMGDGWCTVPTYQQAFRWFREKYNLLGIVGYCNDNSGKFMSVIDKINSDIDYDMNAKDTYEEAEDACLDRLIEIAQK
jgi:hypothetical protein